MIPRRPGRDDAGSQDLRSTEDIVLASTTLRAGDAHRADPPKPAGEERISLFWRVFGGTILSIGALIVITLYNHQTANINELRSEVNRVNEARAELVKKEEFNSRTQNLWDRVQAVQELRVTVTGMKEQVTAIGERTGDMKSVQERLTGIDQRVKAAEEVQKSMARLEVAVATLEQKAAVREAQLKAAEDDRKDLARQLQELRERLAKVEGATEVKPMPKASSGKAPVD